MKKYLTILLVLLATSAMAGDIFKWTDDQGRLHFSDRRPVTNEKVYRVYLSPNSPVPALPAPKLAKASPARSASPSGQPSQRAAIHPPSFSDYDMTRAVSDSGGTLKVYGRINSGPECDGLNFAFDLSDGHSHHAHIDAPVGHFNGYTSLLYEGQTSLFHRTAGAAWQITGSSIHCNSP
jgi:Domain of unknown function (DUF4124)